MFPRSNILLLLALIFFSQPIAAARLTQQRLQQIAQTFLTSHKQEEHFSAIAITIQGPNQPLISAYAGYTNFSNKTKINPTSLFQVGSITKSFIAALLLKLESNPSNHFNLNDPIEKFFPEYGAHWHGITIKQLLNMTSGIPDHFHYTSVVQTFSAHPMQWYQPQIWVNAMYQKPLLFKPGTHFNYSNTNYLILGLLIEKLTGQPLAVAMENFIQPLSLKQTFFVPHQINSARQPYMVEGYQYEFGYQYYIPLGTDVTHYSLSYLSAAGGMVSTTEDMARWVKLLFTSEKVLTVPERGKLNSFISEKTAQPVSHLTAQDTNGYGLGISMQYDPKLKIPFYIYQGMTLGYRAIYVYVPSYDILISITVNSSVYAKANHLDGLIKRIKKIMLAKN